VQLGFISGTLAFALLTVADRFSPSWVFFVSALLAALSNLGVSWPGLESTGLLACRFLTGFFLAGIYPVGMKIAADYYQAGLGKSLGWLVGALVLGTAFPHLLRGLAAHLPWQAVTLTTSALAVLGGLGMVLLVPDGPYRRPAQQLDFTSCLTGFRQPEFRAAAFGYFGHMWELYTFWAFVPVLLASYHARHPAAELNVALLSFGIIGGGSLACVGSGLLSQVLPARTVAAGALALSGLCCLASPLVLGAGSAPVLLGFLFFWGVVVVADSPLFSTLVARSAPEAARGTSLTIVTCLGFALTIVSLQAVAWLTPRLGAHLLLLPLAVGPALGLWALAQSPRPAPTLPD
jgi:MFS family permease